MFKCHKQRGFELIELLIVVAILGILSAVVIPNIVGLLNRSHKDNKTEVTPTLVDIGNCTVKGEIWLRNNSDYEAFMKEISYFSTESAEWTNGYKAYPALANFNLEVPENMAFPHTDYLWSGPHISGIITDPFLEFRAHWVRQCPSGIVLGGSLVGEKSLFEKQIRITKFAFPEWQDTWLGKASVGEYFVGKTKLNCPEEYYQLRAEMSAVSPCWNMGGGGKIIDITGYYDAQGKHHYLTDESQFPIDYPFGFPVNKNFDHTNFSIDVSGCSVPIME